MLRLVDAERIKSASLRREVGLGIHMKLCRLILVLFVGLGLLFLTACGQAPTSTTCRVPFVDVTCDVSRGGLSTDCNCPGQSVLVVQIKQMIPNRLSPAPRTSGHDAEAPWGIKC